MDTQTSYSIPYIFFFIQSRDTIYYLSSFHSFLTLQMLLLLKKLEKMVIVHFGASWNPISPTNTPLFMISWHSRSHPPLPPNSIFSTNPPPPPPKITNRGIGREKLPKLRRSPMQGRNAAPPTPNHTSKKHHHQILREREGQKRSKNSLSLCHCHLNGCLCLSLAFLSFPKYYYNKYSKKYN